MLQSASRSNISLRLKQFLCFGLFGGSNPCDDDATPIDADGWTTLFNEAKSHAVSALLYDAIMKLPQHQRPPRTLMLQLGCSVAEIEDSCRQMEDATIALSDFLSRESNVGISSNRQINISTENVLPLTVVKGPAIAKYYPIPYHREYSDVDLLTLDKTEQISRMIETTGISVDRSDPRHASFIFHDVIFECHNYLLYSADEPQWNIVPFTDDKTDRFCGLNRLSVENEAFFLAKHIEHHAVFFHQNIPLRSLVDWVMLTNAPGFDFNKLDILKKDTDVDRFIVLLTHYCKSLFGLPHSYGADYILPNGIDVSDFDKLYMNCPPRHRLAFVRVFRRSWHYLSHARKYKLLYGKSMFHRFYFSNLRIAIRQSV